MPLPIILWGAMQLLLLLVLRVLHPGLLPVLPYTRLLKAWLLLASLLRDLGRVLLVVRLIVHRQHSTEIMRAAAGFRMSAKVHENR